MTESLDSSDERESPLEPRDERPNAETRILTRQMEALFERALSSLSRQEAAILRLKYV